MGNAMGQSHLSAAFLRRDRWRQNYCLAKADVDGALLHKSYGLSIVADGEPALVKWEKFRF